MDQWLCCCGSLRYVDLDTEREQLPWRPPPSEREEEEGPASLTVEEAKAVLFSTFPDLLARKGGDDERRRAYTLVAACLDPELRRFAPQELSASFDIYDQAYYALETRRKPREELATRRSDVLPTKRIMMGTARPFASAAAASASNHRAASGGWSMQLPVSGIQAAVTRVEHSQGQLLFTVRARYAGLPPRDVLRRYSAFLQAEAALQPLFVSQANTNETALERSGSNGSGGGSSGAYRSRRRLVRESSSVSSSSGSFRGVVFPPPPPHADGIGALSRGRSGTGDSFRSSGSGDCGPVAPLKHGGVHFEKEVSPWQAESRRLELEEWLKGVLAATSRKATYTPELLELVGVDAAMAAAVHRQDMLGLKEEMEGWRHNGPSYAVTASWHRAWLEFLVDVNALPPGPVEAAALAAPATAADTSGSGRRSWQDVLAGGGGGGGGGKVTKVNRVGNKVESGSGGAAAEGAAAQGGARTTLASHLVRGRDYEMLPAPLFALACRVYGSDDVEIPLEEDSSRFVSRNSSSTPLRGSATAVATTVIASFSPSNGGGGGSGGGSMTDHRQLAPPPPPPLQRNASSGSGSSSFIVDFFLPNAASRQNSNNGHIPMATARRVLEDDAAAAVPSVKAA